MGRFVNRGGMRYGSLVAVERVPGDGRPKWRCVCDCGKSVVADGRNLGTGNTTSCGCAWDKAVKGEMVGKRFGSLVVVAPAASKTYGNARFAAYSCKCDCGGEIATSGMSLRNGDVVSCGCAYKAAGARRIKPHEHRREVWQFHNKRRRAARLNAHRPFDAEFFDLLEKEAYSLASLRAGVTGISHEVDHIVPLRSKLVCGLHNEFNLRVIPAAENNRKGNRFWPDMPGSA